jgi:hypothetical protein
MIVKNEVVLAKMEKKKKPRRKLSEEHKQKLIKANTGRKISEETRLKMSLAKKGKRPAGYEKIKLLPPWNKGLTSETDERVKKASNKTKESLLASYSEKRISPWNKGKKIDREKHPNMGHFKQHSAESKEKMSRTRSQNPTKYWAGKPLPDSAKKKLSEGMKKKGVIPPSRKGIVDSEETKSKKSVAMKGKKSGFSGHHHSKEARIKIADAQKGEKHFNWKGGITPLVMKIRACTPYKDWRQKIFEKDNFTCVLCPVKKRGGYLEADHYPIPFNVIFHKNKISSFSEAIACALFWNIDNGRTLCRECHNKNKKWKHLQ